jgi:hypothetical protein
MDFEMHILDLFEKLKENLSSEILEEPLNNDTVLQHSQNEFVKEAYK